MTLRDPSPVDPDWKSGRHRDRDFKRVAEPPAFERAARRVRPVPRRRPVVVGRRDWLV